MTKNTCPCQLCQQQLDAAPQFTTAGYMIMVTCRNPMCDAVNITMDQKTYAQTDMAVYAASVKAGRK